MDNHYPWTIMQALTRLDSSYPITETFEMSSQEQSLRLYRLYLIRAMLHHPNAKFELGDDVEGSINFWLLFHILHGVNLEKHPELGEIWEFCIIRASLARNPEFFFPPNTDISLENLAFCVDQVVGANIDVDKRNFFAWLLLNQPDRLSATLSTPHFFRAVSHVPKEKVIALAVEKYRGCRAFRMSAIKIPNSIDELAKLESLPRTGFDVLFRVSEHCSTCDETMQEHVGRCLATAACVKIKIYNK